MQGLRNFWTEVSMNPGRFLFVTTKQPLPSPLEPQSLQKVRKWALGGGSIGLACERA